MNEYEAKKRQTGAPAGAHQLEAMRGRRPQVNRRQNGVVIPFVKPILLGHYSEK
jgi:hypothetical protein